MAAIEVLHNLDNLLPWFVQHENVWSHYDQEADVLYLHFKKSTHADDSELRDDNIIVRYENGEVIGLTIMNAGKRSLNVMS